MPPLCGPSIPKPTDVESLLIQHDVLHEKYRQYFLLMLCFIGIFLFFDLIVGIVDLSGGKLIVLVIIFLVLVFLLACTLFGSIINIAFNTNLCFTYSNQYILTSRQEEKDEDDANAGLLLREI